MPAIATGWELEVHRGPGWLLVKPSCPSEDLVEHAPLADQVWSLLECHFVYRLVLELDDVRIVDSHLIGQMLALHRRIRSRGGVMRVCGLSSFNQKVLRMHGLIDRFPAYGDLREAVMGSGPCKPR
jgi:hypothetical protein